jgi:3-oxoacyl-[acyl-carrier protein] reductase
MVEKGQGHIVNIASMAALATSAGLSLYSASKFAVRSYTLGLAMELRDKGVSVTVMCPDAIDTPMLEKQEQCEEGAMTFSGVTLTLADIEHSLFDTVLTKKPLEVCLPASRGWQAKLGNLFPPLMLKLASRMNAKGLKRQQQAAEQRNL